MKHSTKDNEKQTLEIIESDFLTAPTKAVLTARLNNTGSPRFFGHEAFVLLTTICDLLLDQASEHRMVDIVLYIDERLHNNQTDGWRYDRMPPDRIVYTQGLKAVDGSSLQGFGKKFIALPKHHQLEMLTSIQKGAVDAQIWKEIDPQLFFEDLLAEATAIFYSHPSVQASINYVGMGDAKGWHKLKLNQMEHLEKRR